VFVAERAPTRRKDGLLASKSRIALLGNKRPARQRLRLLFTVGMKIANKKITNPIQAATHPSSRVVCRLISTSLAFFWR